jgi:hypothetical protein
MIRLLSAAVLLLAGAGLMAGDTTPPRAAANPLLGVWATEGALLIFEEKSLRILMSEPDKPTLIADYSITKDGLVFGIITRERLSGELELPKGSFLDETFRFRVNVEGRELTIKNVRLPVPRIAVEPQVVGIGLLRLEGHLSGTYERTTMEKAGMNRNPIPSSYVESAGPSAGPPSSLPSKRNR